MKTIRSILYRRLKFWLIVGWVIASLAILIATVTQVIESISGRTNHTAQMMLAFAAAQDLSTSRIVIPDQSTFESFGIEDFFTVVIQNDIVRYSSIDVLDHTLLALPLTGNVTLQGSTWKLFGASTPQNDTRVVIGVWKWEAINASIGPAAIVALIVCVFAVLSLQITARATQGVVEPIEDLTAAVEARGEDNLTPIQTSVEIEELYKIELALNLLLVRLQEALTRERQFIFNAAHELRTPLSAIRAQIEALDTDRVNADTLDQLQGVLKASERAARVVEQMLDLARSETIDPQTCNEHTINLEGVAQDVIAELMPDAYRQGGDIELICDQAISVPGSYDHLYSMLRNLIENAVKYGASPARVIVTIGRGGNGQKYISVEDNGSGLSETQFINALEKFERLGQKSDGGVGLGLSIVKQISKRTGVILSKKEANELGGLKLVLHFPV